MRVSRDFGICLDSHVRLLILGLGSDMDRSSWLRDLSLGLRGFRV